VFQSLLEGRIEPATAGVPDRSADFIEPETLLDYKLGTLARPVISTVCWGIPSDHSIYASFHIGLVEHFGSVGDLTVTQR